MYNTLFLILADDCFVLGRFAYNNGDMYHTVLWMSEAVDIWEEEKNKTADKAELLDYLAYAMSMVSWRQPQHCYDFMH